MGSGVRHEPLNTVTTAIYHAENLTRDKKSAGASLMDCLGEYIQLDGGLPTTFMTSEFWI